LLTSKTCYKKNPSSRATVLSSPPNIHATPRHYPPKNFGGIIGGINKNINFNNNILQIVKLNYLVPPSHHKDFQRSSQKSARLIAKRIFCFLNLRLCLWDSLQQPTSVVFGVRKAEKRFLPPFYHRFLLTAPLISLLTLPCPTCCLSKAPTHLIPIPEFARRRRKAKPSSFSMAVAIPAYLTCWRQTMAAQISFPGQRKIARVGATRHVDA
jgi:hypothetical protein